MRKLNTALTVLAALGISTGVALANQAPSFAQVDSNHDGKISKSEASKVTGLSAKFADADANGDGSLDAMEYRAAVNKGDHKKGGGY